MDSAAVAGAARLAEGELLPCSGEGEGSSLVLAVVLALGEEVKGGLKDAPGEALAGALEDAVGEAKGEREFRGEALVLTECEASGLALGGAEGKGESEGEGERLGEGGAKHSPPFSSMPALQAPGMARN